ncbi:hypothetical protein B0H17DRAFT_1142991 [Mycena rosella]|uniref:Uncharacterized protein n=1 Tax=Mycena rosella TaxID=1033263 RepID=A0AAD7CWN0_MYCRO|nr:hypothetical protein B0H17DRAFT_1142991 [Mycena rosella]
MRDNHKVVPIVRAAMIMVETPPVSSPEVKQKMTSPRTTRRRGRVSKVSKVSKTLSREISPPLGRMVTLGVGVGHSRTVGQRGGRSPGSMGVVDAGWSGMRMMRQTTLEERMVPVRGDGVAPVAGGAVRGAVAAGDTATHLVRGGGPSPSARSQAVSIGDIHDVLTRIEEEEEEEEETEEPRDAERHAHRGRHQADREAEAAARAAAGPLRFADDEEEHETMVRMERAVLPPLAEDDLPAGITGPTPG